MTDPTDSVKQQIVAAINAAIVEIGQSPLPSHETLDQLREAAADIQSLPSPAASESVSNFSQIIAAIAADNATLTVEVERLQADYAELAGIAEALAGAGKDIREAFPITTETGMARFNAHRRMDGALSKYATHVAKGKHDS